jgi:hypothetical protein
MYYRQPFEGSYIITQPYGGTDTSAFHTGIDYGCPEGTPILASEAGTVKFAGWDSTGYGYCVIIQHADGNATLYAHLKMVVVKAGQKVERSQVIGYSGTTGNSTGPHLHFEARHTWNDYRSHFDPMSLPLHSSIEAPKDNTPKPAPKPVLKGADALGHEVEVVAPAGAWGWNADFTRRLTAFPCGTDLYFTGKTTERLGYQYCECYPEPQKYWVAVNDHETQILDNQKQE